MPDTRVPKSRPAQITQPASLNHAPPPVSSTPVNADAHARFGHSLGQYAISHEDEAPIQRQPDETAQAAPGPFSGGLFSGLSGMMSGDAQNASAIASQMQSDNQAQQMERWKIQQDTQNKIFNVQQDVTQNKAQTQDKAYKKWDEYIRQ